jgi:hypothetical protein
MKKLFFISLAIVFLISLLGFSNSTYAQQKEKTLKGQIVDILSYSQTGKVSDEMTTEAAKSGKPLGILSGGKVYVAYPKDANTKIADMLTPYIKDKIVAKGLVFTKGTNVIIISNIDKDMKAK